MNFTTLTRRAGLGLAIASIMLLSACGSSSGVSPASGGGQSAAAVPTTGMRVNEVQSALSNDTVVKDATATSNASSKPLIAAINQILNVVRNVVGGLKAVGKTKDVSALNPYLVDSGTQLYGSIGNLVQALQNIQNNLVSLVPADKIPVLGPVLTTAIGELESIENNIKNGYVDKQGSVNLSLVTTAVNNTINVLGPLLTALETDLVDVTGKIPLVGQVVIGLGGVLNTTLGNLKTVLNDLGTLSSSNSQQTANDITALVSGVVNGVLNLASGIPGVGKVVGVIVNSKLGGLVGTLLGPNGTVSSLLQTLLKPVGGLLSGLLNGLLCKVLNPNAPACQG